MSTKTGIPPRKARKPQKTVSWPARSLCLATGLLLAVSSPGPGAARQQPPIELLIRVDDVGMSHSVNLAVRKLLETGMPFSASLMVPCPWFLEAAEMLRDQPQVSVGIHLTLNSEWRHYKWGPVLGAPKVPTLVDEHGHFHTSGVDFAAAAIDLEEVRAELQAQIERAHRAGLRIDYLDYHMLTAVSTPELRSVVEELAEEHGLALSTYFGERSATLWDTEPERKLSSLLRIVERARPGAPSLLVMHLGIENDELGALVDLNNPADPYRVARHRQAELSALTSRALSDAVSRRGLRLINYRQLIERRGLGAMSRPPGSGYSQDDRRP